MKSWYEQLCNNSLQLKAVSYCCKPLHLKCLQGSWVRLCTWTKFWYFVRTHEEHFQERSIWLWIVMKIWCRYWRKEATIHALQNTYSSTITLNIETFNVHQVSCISFYIVYITIHYFIISLLFHHYSLFYYFLIISFYNFIFFNSYFISFITVIYSVTLSIRYFIVYSYIPLVIMLLLNTIYHRRKRGNILKRPVFFHSLDSDNKCTFFLLSNLCWIGYNVIA